MGFVQFQSQFSEFLSEFRAARASSEMAQTQLSLSIKSLSERIFTLETRLDHSVSEQRADISAMKADIITIRAEVASLSLSTSTVDTCETLISDIPSLPQLTHPQIASHVLSTMGLENLNSHIIEVRPWLGARSNGSPTTITTPKQISTPPTSLVVKFSSPMARDFVLAKSNTLHRCRNLESPSKLNQHPRINPLWPKPVYQLWRKALAACRPLNYERPLVKNLTVCMRETRDSPLIPIFSEEALAALPARQLLPTQSPLPPSRRLPPLS